MSEVQLASEVKVVRLLLIDDEPDVREFYRGLLEESGFAVTVAASAKEGARAALGGSYDIAVVDERLPDARGMALVRWLSRRFPKMGLVLFSAYADWGMFFRGCGCGAKDVLAKGRPAAELVRVVRHCVLLESK